MTWDSRYSNFPLLSRAKLDGDGHVEETASEAGAAEMTWGMTGFFFEQPYAEGCTTLVEQIDSLAEAIRGGASKLRDSADSYELADADSQSDLDGAAAEIGG
ncbi:hypothetical protein O1R50_18055 [Glycomyces luteolus]|uniref:Excreted virulence factor EspC (Type VII ESX diderm) n=1 Tax=Glycomyces luteolus TaxID=2670330 RepID=A0A9X3PAN7_9ACTN|nr:hypothetical protein [Glycomyces luteolus]MDA1361537.1 hypothetical protein [Glycomyces luteolus]